MSCLRLFIFLVWCASELRAVQEYGLHDGNTHLAQLSQCRGPLETLKEPLVASGYLGGLCCPRMFFLGAHVLWNRNWLSYISIHRLRNVTTSIHFIFLLGPGTSISQTFPLQFLKHFILALVSQNKSNRLVGPSLFNQSGQRDCVLSCVSCL